MALAVILDMDGLMLDTEPVALRAFRSASRVLGCEFGDELFDRLLGLNARSARELLARHYGEGFPLDTFVQEVQQHYEAFLRSEGVPHKPGLAEFLRFLDERAIPRAVATSTGTAAAADILARAGVAHHFEIVVGGDQVRQGKPAPDIFLEAAARLGRRASECAVLEDSEPGIRAAAAAGMKPILIPDTRVPTPEMRACAHAVVDSLAAARAVVERLLEEANAASE
jgi:HAD superfamily hydrolase (TIGR01509 family)